MELVEVAWLAAAAFVGGAINAVAGGGSLVSFPALLAAGYPSKAANVTNSVALWPGYVSGNVAYWRELRPQRARLLALSLPGVAGAIAGSIILLGTPQSAFDAVVPFLILSACGLMVVQDRLAAWALARRLASADPAARPPLLLLIATFLLAIYGAYFGAGLGILTLAVLGILLPDEIQRSNALKGALSTIINGAGVFFFAFFGPVRWLPALVMGAGAIAGGYLGVGVARRLGRRWLRLAVVSYGAAVAVILLIQ